MKAPSFSYVRPETIGEVIGLLSSSPDESRILAGGQSLVPMLNLRVVSPSILIDVNRIPALKGITVESESVHLGALTRHAQLETSSEISKHLPLLSLAAPHIAHPAIRTRGTFGGSCAFADPSAEIPACSIALDATFVIAGPNGERRVHAQDFFVGPLTTDLKPDELLLRAEFPKPKPGYVSAFGELARRRGDFALVGIAAYGSTAQKRLLDLRIVVFGAGDKPVRAIHLENALQDQEASPYNIRRAITALDADIDPRDDLHAKGQTRRHLARVLALRVLNDLIASDNGLDNLESGG